MDNPKKGKRKIKLQLGQGKVVIAPGRSLLYAKTYNMVKGLKEDKEKELMRQNPHLVPGFMMDLARLAA